MKNWFPFSDYEFYSYLFSGLMLLGGLDLYATDGTFFLTGNFSFVGSVVVVSTAYILGQVISIPSSILLEHWITRKVLRPPAMILLSDKQSKLEKFIEKFLIGRHYSPLPQKTIEKVLKQAEIDTGHNHQYLENNPREALAPAIIHSRKCEQAKSRINLFRNQYSFSRNVSFVSFVLAVLFTVGYFTKDMSAGWPLFSLAVSICMFIRFIKFYSCCATEVVSSYAFRD